MFRVFEIEILKFMCIDRIFTNCFDYQLNLYNMLINIINKCDKFYYFDNNIVLRYCIFDRFDKRRIWWCFIYYFIAYFKRFKNNIQYQLHYMNYALNHALNHIFLIISVKIEFFTKQFIKMQSQRIIWFDWIDRKF